MNSKKLSGKVALITGGGTGIGRVIACTFASNGARIIICDINLKSLEKTKMLINKSGGKAFAIESDISEENVKEDENGDGEISE